MTKEVRSQKACEVGFENGIYLVNFIYPSGEVVPLRALFKESIAWTFDSIMKNGGNAKLENAMKHDAQRGYVPSAEAGDFEVAFQKACREEWGAPAYDTPGVAGGAAGASSAYDTPRSASGEGQDGTAESASADTPRVPPQAVYISDERLKTVMLLQPSIDYLLYLIQRCESNAINELSSEEFFDVDTSDDGSREFSYALADKCDKMFARVAKLFQEKGIDTDTALLDKNEFAAMVDRCGEEKRIARSLDLYAIKVD